MTIRRILSGILCMALLLPCLAIPGWASSEPVVYLDSVNGSDSNDGLSEANAVATLNGAYTALANTIGAAARGTIVLVNDYTYTFSSTGTKRDITTAAEHSYEVVFTGRTPQTALQFYLPTQCYIGMKGPTAFENITVRIAEDSPSNYLSIHGRGRLTIGQGVITSDNENLRPSLSAGAYFNSSAVMELTINSGNWRNAYAGGYVGTMTGTGNLTINGGYVAKAGTNFNGTQNGDSNITVNGGSVGSIIGSSVNSGGKQNGDVCIQLNSGTVETEVDPDGIGTLSGTATVNVAANGLTLLVPGTVAIDDYTGSSLTLGSATKVSISGTASGTTAVTVNPGVRYNFDYITAPVDTADDAFTFSQANMTVESGDNKVWKNLDAASGFTGLVLKAPSGQTVKLYTGTQNGSLVTPDSTKTEDGIRYDYYANIMGTYRYVSSRSGYYTVTKVIYMSEEESLTETVVDATTGKKAGTGFEPTNVKEYSDEMLSQRDSTETAAWWKDYAQYLTTPAFAEGRADHQATTQDEMEAYLAGLDGSADNMYIYSMGKSAKYGYDMPIVIFTQTDLSAAKTLEEAASLINANNKVTVHYQAQIHGNEPAAGEAALALSGMLDTAYGDDLLNTLNIYVIPRLNPDGSRLFTRNDSNNLNMNRDMLLAQAQEIQYHHYVYSLFNPELAIDSHEYTYQPELTSGAFNDMMIASGHNGNSGEDFAAYSEMFARLPFQRLYDYEMQPSYYTNVTNSKYAASGTSYRGMRGSVSLLLESRGIGGGNNTYERRVTAHLISMNEILHYAAKNSAELQAASDAERQRIATSGMTYEDTDIIVLEHEQTTDASLKHTNSTYDLASGTVTSTYNTTPKCYRAAAEGRFRTRPTAYVIPAGESWTQDVLKLMDIQDISYYYVSAGRSISLRQYTGTVEAASLTEEQYYSFPNGCYVLPMNQNNATILAILMEPDIADEYNVDAGGGTTTVPSGTLAQMEIIPCENGVFPIYRYVQDLNTDGTVDSAVLPAAPTGLTSTEITAAGGTGSITGFDAARGYEYRSASEATYTPLAAGATELTGLTAGTYYIRFAADSTAPASADAVITVCYGVLEGYSVYLDSASGSDTNTGYTEDAPVATIAQAYAQLDTLMQTAPDGASGTVILLADYALGSTAFTFPSHDYPVIFTAKTADIALNKGGSSTQATCSVNISGDTTFQNMTLRISSGSAYNNFNANGHNVVMGKGLTCIAGSKGKYFMLAGGGWNQVASTNLTVQSGTWEYIYAGGYTGAVTGDANLTITGGTVKSQIMASYNGAISGNVNMMFSDFTTTAPLFGGNAKTNGVSGNVNITLGKGAELATIYAGSRDSSNVDGTVTLIVDGADVDTAIYGSCKTSGTIGGFELVLKNGSLVTVPTNVKKVTVDTSSGGKVTYPAQLGVEEVIGYGVGKVGTTAYAPLQYAAENATTGYVQLMIDCSAGLKLTGDLYLDLAGYDLGGTIELNSFRLYGLDSVTNDYTDSDAGHLTANITDGAPELHFKDNAEHLDAVMRYMAVADDRGYSFHRFYLGITHASVRTDSDGVGYKALFMGSDTVKNQISELGYSLQLGTNTPHCVATSDFVSGTPVSLVVQNYDIARYGTTPLSAFVFIKVGNETIQSSCVDYSLKDIIALINDQFDALSSAEKQAAITAMVKKYYAVMKDWSIGNIYTPAQS